MNGVDVLVLIVYQHYQKTSTEGLFIRVKNNLLKFANISNFYWFFFRASKIYAHHYQINCMNTELTQQSK